MSSQATDLGRDPHDPDMLAAEYVLGVLDADGLRAARTRMRTDPEFTAEVAAWERHFTPWIEQAEELPVPERLWARIRKDLGWATPGLPPHALAPSWWNDARLWRWLTAGGFATAAASLFALMLTSPAPPPPTPAPTPVVTAPEPPALDPDMIARIEDDSGRTAFVASIDTRHRKIMMVPLSVDIPTDRVPELWLIPAGGKPQSLGLLDPTRAHSVEIPEAMLVGFGTGALVAVSVEPPGGSPSDGPTGPVIAKGGMTLI